MQALQEKSQMKYLMELGTNIDIIFDELFGDQLKQLEMKIFYTNGREFVNDISRMLRRMTVRREMVVSDEVWRKTLKSGFASACLSREIFRKDVQTLLCLESNKSLQILLNRS